MWPLRNELLRNETNWAVLHVAPSEWGEIIITKTTQVLLKCMLSFSWMTSQMNWGCTAHFLAQLFLTGKVIRGECAALPCYTHQLFVSGVCADYLVVRSWPSFPRLHLAVKTILASSVAGVILCSQPHGWETMRSVFPAQCPFQAHCQWGLYAGLLAPGTFLVSSSGYRSVSFSISYPPSLLFFVTFPFSCLFSSQRSQSSLCSSVSEMQNPSQMEVLINSRLVSNFGLEREKRMCTWPTQQPSLPTSGHVEAGEKTLPWDSSLGGGLGLLGGHKPF